MANGNVTVGQLADLTTLSEHRAWTRAVLSWEEDRWLVRYLEAVIGPKPPGWEADLWSFGTLDFVASEVAPSALGEALRTEGTTLELGKHHPFLPALQPNSNWTDHSSRNPHEPSPVEWPTRDFKLYAQNPEQWQQPTGYLVGDTTPSFVTFDSAFRAFFYGDFSTQARTVSISNLAMFRLLQTRARIKHVQIGPLSLDVEVDGSESEGSKLEVVGGPRPRSQTVGRTEAIHFDLPDGLPDDAWLLLSREHEWLDARPIGSQLAFKGDLSKAGVEVTQPQDFESEAEALLATGESASVEYKRVVPDSRDDEAKRKVFKTVAAFANGDGGTILFGVDDDVKPVGIEQVGKEEGRLNDLVRAIVTPDPGFTTQQVTVEGKRILLLTVDGGKEGPYGIRLRSSDHVQYYVRRNGSSYPATAGEVRALARSDVSAVTGSHSGFRFGLGGFG